MNRDESIKLWLQGKDAWNEWAQARLDERKALEEAANWDAKKDFSGRLEGQNQTTKDWILKANVNFINLHVYNIDFKNFIFPNEVDFSNTIFNGDADFIDTTFSGYANFGFTTFSSYADFKSAKFNGSAYFGSAAFSGDAYFGSATFSGVAYFYYAKFSSSVNFISAAFGDYAYFMVAKFSNSVDFISATFGGNASFSSAAFSGNTYFSSAAFSGYAYFGSATFSGYAGFDSATFSGDANFGSATFSDDANFISAIFKGHTYFNKNKGNKNCLFEKTASFNSAHFKKQISFKQAIFKDIANFASITSDKSFNLLQTDFTLVPDFTEAAFHAPPVLDEIKIAEPLLKRPCNWNGEHKDPRKMCKSSKFTWPIANDPTDTRKYRALAKMAAEAKDYQNEMQFFADEQRCRRFWHDKPFGKGMGRFWFGLVYEKASDFGRSFLRPAIGWLGVFIAFAVYYGLTTKTVSSLWDPIYLSLRHGLVISGLTRNDHMKSISEQMYSADLPAFAFIAQTFISAVFIFLLLLAIRNQFKIR